MNNVLTLGLLLMILNIELEDAIQEIVKRHPKIAEEWNRHFQNDAVNKPAKGSKDRKNEKDSKLLETNVE